MKGTYTIILACEKPFRAKFGMLGSAEVNPGYYAYTGSALGRGAVSLEGRLARHARRIKKKRWHIDFLTTRKAVRFKMVLYLVSNKHLECKINQAIQESVRTASLLPHLGASDCKCQTHLVRVTETMSEAKLSTRLERIYSTFGTPFLWTNEKPRSFGLLPIFSGTHRGRS
jgi:sugar fermentation stimulation protein A